jgi:hypothetical protein
MPESSDQFSAGGDLFDDDMDDDMPTDAEASKYSFHDRLEYYMESALISEDNRKAVELARKSQTSASKIFVQDQRCSLPIKAPERKYWREAHCGGSTRMS